MIGSTRDGAPLTGNLGSQLPDALHIASVHAVEYLLTWNCSHIANAELLPHVTILVEEAGFNMPFVCTPEELQGDSHDP
ncbi:MAG TPA: hypothetical protein VN493_15115 [Thermoanaerobaculia bacterium]|nr:hypothetical protein [Thermoanaerobaculia bacterium]